MVRADLSPGAQTAQAVHAATEYVATRSEQAKHWRKTSNSLVVVTVPTEDDLYGLILKADDPVVFREPDYDNQITAVALPPGNEARRLCSNFPLAGKGLAMT